MVQQPLNNRIPIVKGDGSPTDYFIRLLQDRGITLDNKITEEEAQALIDAWAAGRDIFAGFGLSGGGNLSSDVTINLDASLGDLNDVDFSTPPTNGQTLVYDAIDGVWRPGAGGSGGGGGFSLISDTTLGSPQASVLLSTIPQDFEDLYIAVESRLSTASAPDFGIQFNSDAGANYISYTENRFGTATNTTMARFGAVESSSFTAGVYAISEGVIFNYKDASRFKGWLSQGFYPSGSFTDRNAGVWRSNAAISSLLLLPSSGSFNTDTRIRLFGRGGTGGGGGGGIPYSQMWSAISLGF